jgi:hypothetical protein
MPEICRFLGIIVAMYYDEHAPPHFHVRYGSQRARFAIDGLHMLDGDIGPRVRGLVVEWASRHQRELQADWERARDRKPLVPIDPLE